MGARDLSRWRRPLHAAMFVLLACVTLGIGSAARSDAASSSTVVAATVPSAISLDTAGCQTAAALDLGLVPAGAWSIGGPCAISFGSSNDTALLRMWQRDEVAPALESTRQSWTARSGSSSWYAVAAGTTSGVAWSAGYGGPGEPSIRFERSSNGGASWSGAGLTTCAGQGFIDLDAFSDTDLWAATSTRVCRSTDGGQSWTTSYTIPTGGFAHMVMMSPTLGYAVGTGRRLYRTTDGDAWTLLGIVPSASFDYFGAVHADASGTIVISGRTSTLPTSSYGVVWSTDGGTTWSEQVIATSPGVDTYGVFGALVIDASTLLASGPGMRTVRGVLSGGTWTWTQVHGATWSRVPYVRSGDGAIFAVTGGDSVYRSTDAGATWTTLPMATGSSTHQREIAGNGSELWVVGYAARRLASGDAGASWTAEPAKPGWNAALAWTSSTWFVAGSGGNAVRTTDAGATLAPVTLGTSATINDGVTYPGGIGVIVGTASTILRTTDHGVTWTPVTAPAASESWNEVTLDEHGTAWMVSSSGKVASSGDQGRSWTLETTVPGSLSLQAVSAWAGQIWVGGSSGGVWRAANARPLAWTAAPTPRTATVTSIWAIDATTAVALTAYDTGADASHLSRTTDGGATWTVSSTDSIRHTREIAVDDGHRFGWLTGASSIAHSSDRGVTWDAPSSVGVSQYVDRIQPLNGGRLLAVGDASLISLSAPTASVPDGLAGSSGFGACLETATGVAAAHWTVAGAGSCTAALTGNWTPIAATSAGATSRIATTATGDTAALALRFALHADTSTPAAPYAANLVIEAVAPGV